MTIFEELFAALNRRDVRYVVVGGVAVVLHGHPRLTADVDLAVDLGEARAREAIDALTDLGYRPRAPVDPGDFADPDVREVWMREKEMRVFALYDPEDPMRAVDLFVENPIPFEDLWRRSIEIPLAETKVRVASIDDLIRMKRLAGRPQDEADIEALQEIAARAARAEGEQIDGD